MVELVADKPQEIVREGTTRIDGDRSPPPYFSVQLAMGQWYPSVMGRSSPGRCNIRRLTQHEHFAMYGAVSRSLIEKGSELATR